MSYTIKQLPESERPRERLENKGVESLSDAELIALIIISGLHGKNAKDIGKDILGDMSVDELEKAHIEDITQFEGIGKTKAGQIVAAFELARRSCNKKTRKIDSFSDAKDLFSNRLKGLEQEELHAAYLAPNNDILTVEKVFKGSLKNMSIDKREIIRHGLVNNASAVVLAHNHPLGDSNPSENDVTTTEELERALEEFSIKLLDHIVVGKDGFTSMKKEELV